MSDVDVPCSSVHMYSGHMIVPVDSALVDVKVAPHLLHPDTSPVIVRHQAVRHVQVHGLLQPGRDLEEELRLHLLLGGEGDEHVVARGDDALWSGEVVDGDGLQEPAGGVRAVPHLQEGAVVQAGHEVYKVESQDVSSLGVELLLARPAGETIIPAC